MGRTLETDTSGHTVSFKVPYDADPKDVAAVKKQLELENFYAVKLVNTLPPPSGIDMPQAMGALKGILASTISELQSIGDTTRKDIRADLEAIYLPKPAPALKA
jgi:hypothetical protein